MGSSKGQSANELLIIYMFLMLMFTVFVAAFSQQRSAEIQQSTMSIADSVGQQFANELNFAAESGNGYSRKIVYPILLNGITPYSVIVNNISKSIDVNFQIGSANYSHSFPLITSTVIVEPPISAVLPNGSSYGYVIYSSNYSFFAGYTYIKNINGVAVVTVSPYRTPMPNSILISLGNSTVWGGVEVSNITATVGDTFGDAVPDGTMVHFQTTTGTIDEFAPTLDGNATAVLMNSSPATVVASVSGVISYWMG